MIVPKPLGSSLPIAAAGMLLAATVALAQTIPQQPAQKTAPSVQRPQVDPRTLGRACPQGQHWDAQSGRCVGGTAATPIPIPQPQPATPIPIPQPQ